ncbi:MAG: hypothetical protein V1848_01645 [Candidatus Magasanikbacteria bacterium]
MKNEIGENILKIIESKQIHPESKMMVFARRSFWWTLAVVLIVGAIVSVSLFSFLCVNTDWGIFMRAGTSPFLFHLLSAIPYFWLLFLCIFIFGAYVVIRHTNFGHRYRTGILAGILSVSICVLGIISFAVGIGELMETRLQMSIPMYKMMDEQRQHFWQNPEAGYLAGIVVGYEGPYVYLFEDVSRKLWKISLENAQIMPNVDIQLGMRLKLEGKQMSDTEFTVMRIYPWFPKRQMKEIPFPIRNTR